MTVFNTAFQKATATSFEPAFETVLRACSVHDSVIWALRISDITDWATFCDLDSCSEAGHKVTARDLGIDVRPSPDGPEGIIPKREVSRLMNTWKWAKVQREAKL